MHLNPIVSECIPIDFSIALDSSGSVQYMGWQKMLKFSRDLIDRMTLSPACAKASMISFGTHADVYSRLDQHTDRTSLYNVIMMMPFKDQWTNTGDAFKKMTDVVYVTSNGDRSDKPNVALVITDGESNRNSETTLPNAQVNTLSFLHHGQATCLEEIMLASRMLYRCFKISYV